MEVRDKGGIGRCSKCTGPQDGRTADNAFVFDGGFVLDGVQGGSTGSLGASRCGVPGPSWTHVGNGAGLGRKIPQVWVGMFGPDSDPYHQCCYV